MNIFNYCSWLENDIGSNIIDFVNRNKYNPIPRSKIDRFFKDNCINYKELPRYLKDKIDELDVY